MNALRRWSRRPPGSAGTGGAGVAAEEVVVGDVVLIAVGRRGARGRADRRASSSADRRVGADRGERRPPRRGRDARRRRPRSRRADRHGFHAHAGHPRQRADDRRHRHRRAAPRWARSPACSRQRPASRRRSPPAEHPDAVDRRSGRLHDGDHVRARSAAGPVLDCAVRERRRARHSGDSRGDADGPSGRPVARGQRPRAPRRHRQGPRVGGDTRIDLGDQLGQDGHADDEPDDGRRGGRPDRPILDLRDAATSSRARSSTPPAPSDTIEDAILPYIVASDAKLVDGKVVGDPTEGALLVLGHKAGLDIEATRARYPRLATLPFDPTYKLMAAFARRRRTRPGTRDRALLRQGRRRRR